MSAVDELREKSYDCVCVYIPEEAVKVVRLVDAEQQVKELEAEIEKLRHEHEWIVDADGKHYHCSGCGISYRDPLLRR